MQAHLVAEVGEEIPRVAVDSAEDELGTAAAQRGNHARAVRALEHDAVHGRGLLPVALVAFEHDLAPGRVDRLDRERATVRGKTVGQRRLPAPRRVLENVGRKQVGEQRLPPGIRLGEDDPDELPSLARLDRGDQLVSRGVGHAGLGSHRLGEVGEVLHGDGCPVGPRRLGPDAVLDRERVLTRHLGRRHETVVESRLALGIRPEDGRQQQL